MGYYVHMDGELTIRAENVDEAYRRLVALDTADDVGFGWQFDSPEGEIKRRFSWLATGLAEHYPNLAELLGPGGLGFEVMDTGDGGLVLWGYDNKAGNEEDFLGVIADLIEGEAAWEGEDGEKWKVEYPSGRILVGVTMWVEPNSGTWVELNSGT